MQTAQVISENGLQSTPTGCRIDIRLPWYRSLPLSTVEVGEVRIDGQLVDPAKVSFELEGRRHSLQEMPELVDKVWYVLDSAFLDVQCAPMAVNSEYEVSVTLNLYPPYIRGLKRITRDSKTMQAT